MYVRFFLFFILDRLEFGTYSKNGIEEKFRWNNFKHKSQLQLGFKLLKINLKNIENLLRKQKSMTRLSK